MVSELFLCGFGVMLWIAVLLEDPMMTQFWQGQLAEADTLFFTINVLVLDGVCVTLYLNKILMNFGSNAAPQPHSCPPPVFHT